MATLFAGDVPLLYPGRCLNRRHSGADCTRCVDACPVAAITLVGNAPQLAPGDCVRCGACLPVCPTDSFAAAPDYERTLRATVAHLPATPTALVCAVHPTPAQTASGVDAVVQHRRCLAALSVADLLELGEGGRRPLWLDDSPCAACPIGAAQHRLHGSARAARALLQATGRVPAIVLHSERPPADGARPQRRPLLDGAQPAMSRRSFLARLRPSQQAAGSAAPVQDSFRRGAAVSARLPEQVPVSRQRLLAVLAGLSAEDTGVLPTDQAPFAAVQVDAAACSACALCARFCPTAALHFQGQADTFALTFQPAACVDCGICVAACPEDAVKLGHTVHLSAIVEGEVHTLSAGALAPCTGCGALTAPLTGELAPRCHVCRQGAGVVTSQRDEAGLMDDLLRRVQGLAGRTNAQRESGGGGGALVGM